MRHTDDEGKITVQHPANKLRELSINVLPSLDVQQLTIWVDRSAYSPQCCLRGQLHPGVLLKAISTSAGSHSHAEHLGGHVLQRSPRATAFAVTVTVKSA